MKICFMDKQPSRLCSYYHCHNLSRQRNCRRRPRCGAQVDRSVQPPLPSSSIAAHCSFAGSRSFQTTGNRYGPTNGYCLPHRAASRNRCRRANGGLVAIAVALRARHQPLPLRRSELPLRGTRHGRGGLLATSRLRGWWQGETEGQRCSETDSAAGARRP